MSGRKDWFLVVASSVMLVSFAARSTATAQESEDPWSAFRFLVGSWDGQETGAAGIGKGDRTYEFIMGGKYLLHRNTSKFEPQARNPDGEVHENWAIFSYDENRGRLALREFHIEGFVIDYVLAHFDEEMKRAVFGLREDRKRHARHDGPIHADVHERGCFRRIVRNRKLGPRSGGPDQELLGEKVTPTRYLVELSHEVKTGWVPGLLGLPGRDGRRVFCRFRTVLLSQYPGTGARPLSPSLGSLTDSSA